MSESKVVAISPAVEVQRSLLAGETVICPEVNGTQLSVTFEDWSAEGGFTYAAPKRYGTILADPPWQESGGGKVKRGADRHYPLMKLADICALPIGQLALPDSHLYLWATNNFLERAFEVIRAWGFTFVTCITWGKMGDRGIQEGLGQYFRGSSEQLLFCKRGQPTYRVKANGKRAQGRTLYLAPRTEHSEKPECFREVIERVSAGPYLELFARRPAPGWDLWGNQAPDSIEIPGSVVTPAEHQAALDSLPFTNEAPEEDTDAEEND
ncbi:MAG: MT-A70 family methyltransferase [Archangium sp.]|nr:MT-A70 family methyltransferase [Archangium sp.]